MNALDTAIYSKLSADSTLVGLLGTFTEVTPNVPCIFSADPVPAGAPRPYVVWNGAMHDEPFGGKVEDTTGREVHVDIRIYDDGAESIAGGASVSKINQIVERIRALLHNQALTVSGYTNTLARCIAGPIHIPTAPELIGRALTFKWLME